MLQTYIKVLGNNYELPQMHFMSVCYGIQLRGNPDDFILIYETGDDYNGGSIVCCVCDNEGMGIGYMIIECNGVYFEVSFIGVTCEPIWEQLPFK